jgi:hypothetical protein
MADSTAIDYGRAMPIRLAGFAMLFVSLVVTPTALAGGPG